MRNIIKILLLKFTFLGMCILLVVTSELFLVYANNYLSNSSFTGNAQDWTLNNINYDGTYYQDTAGSIKTETTSGNSNSILGTAQQTILNDIKSNDIVELSFYWNKQCVTENCIKNEIKVQIAESSNPLLWTTIWSNNSIPTAGNPTGWTHVNNLDVSSYFSNSTTYLIRLTADLENADHTNAQSLAWFDNLNLKVTKPTLNISTEGSQKLTLPIGGENKHTGGAFTFQTDKGSTNISEIKIKNTGTLNYTDISNIFLYYKQESTCSFSIPQDATKFNTTATSFNTSNIATANGNLPITTSKICIYIQLDISSEALEGKTLNLRIADTSTDIGVENANILPIGAVILDGNSTIKEHTGINYIINPSFTTNANDWTLNGFTYDNNNYSDTAGSIKAQTSTGSQEVLTGAFAKQDFNSTIDTNDTVELSLNWRKQCIEIACGNNYLAIEIAKTSSPTSFTEIWSNSSIPNAGNPTEWSEVNLDVSQFFDNTTTYIFRVTTNLESGNDQSAQALAWFDNLNLEVTKYEQGFLLASIRDTQGNPVENPTVNLPEGTFNMEAKTETFYLGNENEQIYILNTTDVPTWSFSIATKDGASAQWESNEHSYKFNGTATEGRLEIDSSNIAITSLYGCNATGLVKGEASYFQAGIVDEITILSASETSGTGCAWLVQGIKMIQEIPAGQPIGNYKLPVTLTII